MKNLVVKQVVMYRYLEHSIAMQIHHGVCEETPKSNM